MNEKDKEIIDAIADMKKNGMTMAQIADNLGVALNTLVSAEHRLRNNKAVSEKTKAKIRLALAANTNIPRGGGVLGEILAELKKQNTLLAQFIALQENKF